MKLLKKLVSQEGIKGLKVFPTNKRRALSAAIVSGGGLLGILASTFQAAQAYYVLGVDNRVTPSYTWMVSNQRQAVGQLEIQKADGLYYNCTFTVVGRNIGLTNTHCLIDAQGRMPRQVKAYALKHGTQVYATANVDLFWLGTKVPFRTVSDRVRDWAVIRFTNNLGNTTGWFGYEPWYQNVAYSGKTVVGKTANHIGYSGDWPTPAAIRPGDVRGYTPGGHFGCRLNSVESGLLIHDCDATPGASGTGIHNNNRQIMALYWGGISQSNGVKKNSAVPLERFIPAIQKLISTGADSSTIVPVP